MTIIENTSPDALAPMSVTEAPLAEAGHPEQGRYLSLWVFTPHGASLVDHVHGIDAAAAVYESTGPTGTATLFERSADAVLAFADLYRPQAAADPNA